MGDAKPRPLKPRSEWQTWMESACSGQVQVLQQYRDRYGGGCTAEGVTALMYAAAFGRAAAVRELCAAEAGYTDIGGRTALMYAVRSGCEEAARVLAPYEAGIADNSESTALMLAAVSGKERLVRLLLPAEKGAANSAGLTALMLATQARVTRTIAPLLQEEAGMKNSIGQTALMLAVLSLSEEVISLFLEDEPALKREARACDQQGCTASMLALEIYCRWLASDPETRRPDVGGLLERVLEVLLPLEGDVYKSGSAGATTPLMLAAKANLRGLAGYQALARQVGLADGVERTALFHAAETDALEAFDYLYPREKDMRGKSGETVFHVAARCGSVKILRKYVRAVDDPSVFYDKRGRSLLAYAARGDQPEVVEFLLSENEALDLVGKRDDAGNTALFTAITADATRAAWLLLPREGGLLVKERFSVLDKVIQKDNAYLLPDAILAARRAALEEAEFGLALPAEDGGAPRFPLAGVCAATSPFILAAESAAIHCIHVMMQIAYDGESNLLPGRKYAPEEVELYRSFVTSMTAGGKYPQGFSALLVAAVQGRDAVVQHLSPFMARVRIGEELELPPMAAPAGGARRGAWGQDRRRAKSAQPRGSKRRPRQTGPEGGGDSWAGLSPLMYLAVSGSPISLSEQTLRTLCEYGHGLTLERPWGQFPAGFTALMLCCATYQPQKYTLAKCLAIYERSLRAAGGVTAQKLCKDPTLAALLGDK